jgi:hypothetical protein
MAVVKNVAFSRKAAADMRSARYWYGEQNTALADEYLKVLAEVGKNPSAYRFVNKKVRRCEPNRFPYYIYFSYNNSFKACLLSG